MKRKLFTILLVLTFAASALAITGCKVKKDPKPSATPTPSVSVSVAPSVVPSVAPSVVPSVAPSVVPSVAPSVVPSATPSVTPSVVPSVIPTAAPSVIPSVEPSVEPSVAPSETPSVIPTVQPSTVPSVTPSVEPSVAPSVIPSVAPSVVPSETPSITPTAQPSTVPSVAPTVVPTPSVTPTVAPTVIPTPSVTPTVVPTPSVTPTVAPTVVPTPSVTPTVTPTVVPTPSVTPTVAPSVEPSVVPSVTPTATPPATTNKIVNGDFPSGTSMTEAGANFDTDNTLPYGTFWGWNAAFYGLSEDYNRYVGDGTSALLYARGADADRNSWLATKMAVESGKTYVFSFDMMCIDATFEGSAVIELSLGATCKVPNDLDFVPVKEFAADMAWGTMAYKTYSYEFTATHTGAYYFEITFYGMTGIVAFDEFKCYEKGQTLPDKSETYEEYTGVAVNGIVYGDCPTNAPINNWGWITDDDNSVAPGTFWGYNSTFYSMNTTYNRYIGDGTGALVYDSASQSIDPNSWIALKMAVENGKTYVFSFDMMSIDATPLAGNNVHLSLVTECKENGSTTVIKDFVDVITWGTQPYGTYSVEFTATKTGSYYFRIMLYAFEGLVAFDEFTCYEKGATNIPVKNFPKYEGPTTVTLSFSGGEGATGSMSPETVSIGGSVQLPANGFTKTNYDFVNWTINGTTYEVGDSVVLTQNSTAVANWKQKDVGVNLVSNGTFDTAGTGFPADWWGYNHESVSTVSVTNGSLFITSNNSNACIMMRIPVSLKAGIEYTFSADIVVNSMQTGTSGPFVGFAVTADGTENSVKPENSPLASLFYTNSLSVSSNEDFHAYTGYQADTFTVTADGTYYVVFASWVTNIDLVIDNVSIVGAYPTTAPTVEQVRILISSDMHYTPDSHSWYGVGSNARLQQWVDGIKAEHQKDPIDALVILGDESLDHWAFSPYGYYLTTGTSYTKLFIDNYVSQLPSGFPIYYVPGNHEQYGNAKWVELTGQNRQGYFTVGDNLFVLSDTYAGNLDPTTHHDGVYTGVDMNHLLGAVKANANVSNVWLLAHDYALAAESTQFLNFLSSNQRVRGLFMGHTHLASVNTTNYRGLTIAQTGNFSYTQDNASLDAWKTSFWGYRELIINANSAVSNYIIPATSATYTDGGSATSIPYQKVHQATYTF